MNTTNKDNNDNNNDDNGYNDDNDDNLLNEGIIESEVKLVQRYIKRNQEEYLASFLKIDGQLSVPKLERSDTYCAPKLDQSLLEEDLEDLEEGLEDLPTFKIDYSGLIIPGIKEFFEREDQQEHAPPMFKKGLVVVIDPADWIGRTMPAYKNSEFGVRYVLKGDV